MRDSKNVWIGEGQSRVLLTTEPPAKSSLCHIEKKTRSAEPSQPTQEHVYLAFFSAAALGAAVSFNSCNSPDSHLTN